MMSYVLVCLHSLTFDVSIHLVLKKYLISAVHITEHNWLLTITETLILVTWNKQKDINDYKRQEENINN